MRFSLMALCGMALGSLSATASPIVFTNGPTSLGNSHEMTAWVQAENFVLPTRTLIDGILFHAVIATFGAGYEGSITYLIYSDSGGAPDAVLHSGTANPVPVATGNFGVLSTDYPEYILSFAITPFLVEADTQYWLGLHNGPLSHQTRDQFYWVAAEHGASSGPRGIGDPAPFEGSFTDSTLDEHYFQLTGTAVPEPSTLSMVALCFAGIVWGRRMAA